jgi:hypothetical protein
VAGHVTVALVIGYDKNDIGASVEGGEKYEG